MGLFDRFPYSNPYQLNLDWIIAQMRKFEADYNQLDPESFLRKSGGLVNGMLRMGENGSVDMNGKPLVGLKTAVNSGDALPFGQAEGYYLRKSGDKMSGTLDMDGNAITNIPAPVADSDAVNKKFVEDKIGTPEAPGAYLPLAGGMMSGDINMDGHSLTGIQNPINGLDAVNKAYLDGINDAIRQWALTSFAPSGFGLGDVKGLDAPYGSANQCTNGGFWIASADCPHSGVWTGITIPNPSYVEQIAVAMTNDVGCIAFRKLADGAGEWEYLNPPMNLGVEYPTVYRYNGKKVFTALINLGYAPNSTTANINTGLTATQVFEATGRIGGGGVVHSLPYENENQKIDVSGYANASYQLWGSMKTNFDGSKKVIWAKFWYIKE